MSSSETATALGAVATTAPSGPAPAVRQQVRSTDWTRALLGSEVIKLRGFDGPVETAPGIPWINIGPDELAPQEPGVVAARIRARTVGILASAAVLAALVFGALAQAWLSNAAAEQRLATLPAWTVTQIDEAGLSIVVDGRQSKPVRIRVGEQLPTGERLVDTDPARNIYRTPSTSVLVRPVPNEPSHSQ